MADVLYATHGGFGATDTNLYTINPSGMAQTAVGDTGHFFTGIAFDPTNGTLYGVTGNLGSDQQTLFTISTTTGAVTSVGALGTTIADITFDASGQMYGWKQSTKRLATINKATGSVAEVGASGIAGSASGNGIAVDPADDNLVWLFPKASNGDVYNVNKTTGAATDVGVLFPSLGGFNANVGAAAFGPSDVLYGVATDSTSTLFTVGAVSGGAYPLTTVGQFLDAEPWDGLAWSIDTSGGAYPTSASVLGVSIAFDADLLDISPTWTRIDQDAVVTGWSIDRGRASEVEKTGTGTATVSIVDNAGDFDPTNSSSPFYGKLDPMKQAAIALYNPVASTWTTIFRGFVAEWLTEIDATEKFFNVTLELVDAMDVFARLQMQPGAQGIGLGPDGSENDVFFEGEPDTDKHVNGRINDALDNVSWPEGLREIFSGNVTVRQKTYDRSDTILSVIQDAADAEFPDAANFYISKDGIATFHGRYARFYPTVSQYGITTWPVGDQTACAGDTTVVPVAPISMRRSENDLINSVLSMPHGLTDIFDPADFVVEDAVSIGKYGYRSENFEDLLVYQGHDDVGDDTSSLAETLLYSTYFIDNYATPKTRVPELVFRPRPVGTQNASAWWGFVCGLDISDRVHLATTHPGGGGFSEYFFVEGVHYDADFQGGGGFTNVTLTVDVSPASFYSTSPFGTVDGSIPTGHLRGATMSVSVTGSTA